MATDYDLLEMSFNNNNMTLYNKVGIRRRIINQINM